MNFHTKESADTLTIFFSGKLDVDQVAKLWQPCLALLATHQPPKLILDLAAVDYCDVAGITFLQALAAEQTKRHAACDMINLHADFQRLLTSAAKPITLREQEYLSQQTLPEHFGRLASNIFANFCNNIVFIGLLTYHLYFTALSPKKIRWHDFMRIVGDTGPKALGIIALIGFLIGLISTFQSAPSFRNFGAQIFMVNLVSLGLAREIGPLLTSVLIAGRTASSFAAELGTMKVNQEIDALQTMGISPIRFLVVPRVLAAMFMAPLLEIFFIFFGLLGCLIVMIGLGYTFDAFWTQLIHAVKPMDLLGGIIKITAFGFIIGAIGCLNGLATGFGAEAVGRSTTRAVVSSLIMLAITDGIFASVYYVLKI